MATQREIFFDIAHGNATDVPYLVSAWEHLVGHEYGAQEFAQAYVDFVRQWDWQWVKINPRAVYYAEAWGNLYDQNDYGDYVIPKKLHSIIHQGDDVRAITKLEITENPQFVEASQAARLIREALPDRAVIQTIFSPLSVLLQIADLPLYPNDEYATPDVTIDDVIYNQPEVAKQALTNIAHTLADYAAQLVTPIEQGGAGLDGIFYAVTGTVSDGYFSLHQYDEFGFSYDRIVFDAIRRANPNAIIVLHTCRSNAHPEWFADEDIDIIHWDQYAQGNPQADVDLKAVPVAGANALEFLAEQGSVDQVRQELNATRAIRQGKPFLLAPSCTVITPANDEALQVLSDARIGTSVEETLAV